MLLCTFIGLILLKNTYTSQNDILFDFFKYKEVHSVVGSLCGDAKYDLEFIRTFNHYGINAVAIRRNMEFYINKIENKIYWKIGIFLDIRCQNTNEIAEILKKASGIGLFGSMEYWLFRSSSLDESLKIINDTNFSVTSDFTIAVWKNGGFNLYDIYNHCHYRGGLLNVTFAGTWSKTTKINFILPKNKLERRWNFHKMTLKSSGYVNYRPKGMTVSDYLQDYETNTLDSMAKFSYAIWLHVSELFNFTIVPGEFTKWEKTDKQGPMVNGVTRRDQDLSGTAALFTAYRTEIVSCAAPYWPFRTCFMFRTQQAKDIKVNTFIRPLAPNCWCFLLIVIILICAEFLFFLNHENLQNFWEKFSVAVLLSIGSLCQQGSAFLPNKSYYRISFISTMIFSLLMYNYYSASIISSRLNEPLNKMNDSLLSLSKSEMKIASEHQIYLDYFLQGKDWETKTFYKKKWLKIPKAKRYLLPSEGIRQVLDGKIAYHTDPIVGYPLIGKLFNNQQICELTEVHLVPPTEFCFFVSRNGSFFEISKIALLKMFEVGIRQRQVKRWTARKPLCRKDLMSISSVTIYEVAFALILLITGIFISIMICGFEYLTFFRIKGK